MKDLRARVPEEAHDTCGTTTRLSAAYQEVAERAASLYGESAGFRNELGRDAASQWTCDVDGTPLLAIDGGAK